MGNIIVDEERNKKLVDVIYLLSDPNLSLKNIGKRREIYSIFEEIYWQGDGVGLYRHLYSDLFDVIIRIDKSETNDVEILIQNIQSLCLHYDHTNSKVKGLDIGDALIKLYDHISLDVKRLQYTKAINYEHQGNMFAVANKVVETERNVRKEIEHTVADVQTDFEKLIGITKIEMQESNNEELSKMRAEYISILGIFASIVLAFIGGMTFSTSVLENINKASAYRMVLISLIIGLVFFNIVWCMMDFIRKIHKGESGGKYLWIGVNLLLVLGVVCSCLAYKYDWFEKEEKITQYKNRQMEQEIEKENTVSQNDIVIDKKE